MRAVAQRVTRACITVDGACVAEMGAGLLVPMHHDMFAGNLGSTGSLVDLAAAEFPEVPIMVPARDRPFVVHGRRDDGA